ncbi:MAG: winged helix-turn-helix transcriptional regulator [Nevskia sp.]|nr:winged helix-turn-helix transcriptional regulator [Nevskia sp.]
MVSKQDYIALSDFRFRLARFLRFSEAAARAAGLTPVQYLLLLHVRGAAGREWATVGELAERLQASPHGTVALVQRCQAKGLVAKKRSRTDARQVEIHLTPQGRQLLRRVAAQHKDELRTLRQTFRIAQINQPPAA